MVAQSDFKSNVRNNPLTTIHFQINDKGVPQIGTPFLYLCRVFSFHQKLRPTRIRVLMMYTLNFPNGMSQTYSTSGELMNAAHKMGGTAKAIGNKTYVFVPKK